MSIQDWGAIGEVLGAIAIFVTLIYLATQIRQSNAASRTSSRQTIIDTFYEANWNFASAPEMRRIVMGGLLSGAFIDHINCNLCQFPVLKQRCPVPSRPASP